MERSPGAGSREPRAGLEVTAQPLGGSGAAAASSPALRAPAPAWRGLRLRLRLRLPLRPVLGLQRRRPPGLRSIAASRLRLPPARTCPPAAPPSVSRAAARAFVRRAGRAPRARALPPRTPGRRRGPGPPPPPPFPAPREPREAPPAFRPRRVLAPTRAKLPPALFLGQSPRGGENEVREGSRESQRVTWSSCSVPEGPDCPRLFWPVLVGRSLDLFQRREINPSPPIQNALTHSTTGPSVHPPVCPFILPHIHPISTRHQKTTRLLRDLGSAGPWMDGSGRAWEPCCKEAVRG